MKFRGSVKVHTVDLMRSQLSKEGAKYTVLSSHKLTGTGI